MHKGVLLVLSGFSGSGKGTVVKQLLSKYDNYALSISMTTRQPRSGEIDQKDYFFVSKDEFEQTIVKDGFIEYASYCDNYYGTPKEYVERCLDEGYDVILEIETQGALKVKESHADAVLLFITPPTISQLKDRLRKRGTESEDKIAMRMQRASEEVFDIEKYDFVVVNSELEKCVEEIHAIIQSAHRDPKRNQNFIEQLKNEFSQI